MKRFTALFLLACITVLFIRSSPPSVIAKNELEKTLLKRKQWSVGCSPNLALVRAADNTSIPLLEGWGNYQMAVTTANDSARIYFEQGISMYYGFHVIEALASFDKAVSFDSSFAMGYWGQAIAYGPNINDYGYTASPDALKAVRNATSYSKHASPVEKGLIHAMQSRYSADSGLSREQLNQSYADAMKALYRLFPNDADVATLYTDALMLQHPWDLYYRNYQAKEWTAEIVQTLEKTLQHFPRHPGAAHYYIHAVEASAHPEKGLAAAKALPSLMPGVAHVVHMPSHIYIRSGFYNEGEQVNDSAVKGYYNYLQRYPAVVNNAGLYLLHNLHMQATCANLDGNYALSLKSSLACKNSFDSTYLDLPDYMGIFMQYVYMTPYLTQIRFGRWNDILATTAVNSQHVFAGFLWHYGRGLAFSRKHDFLHAKIELDSVELLMKAPQLKAPAPSFANAGFAAASVAHNVLKGVLAEEQGDLISASQFLKAGVLLEDSMIYNEPKDWVHPVRQYLGNVLLKQKKFSAAEEIFKQDLVVNPNNGWSLTGLASSLDGQGKSSAARDIRSKAVKALARADMKIAAAVF